MKRILLTVAALATALAALYVSESPPRAAFAAATHDVSIVSTSVGFDPASVTVTKGDTVRWTNDDSITHSVTSDTGAWTSQDLTQKQKLSTSFRSTGEFSYHCRFHATMTGTVVVQAPVIPGVGQWGLVVLGGLLSAAVLLQLRRTGRRVRP